MQTLDSDAIRGAPSGIRGTVQLRRSACTRPLSAAAISFATPPLSARRCHWSGSESEQMAAGLKSRGVPVTYVSFNDEGHGFVRPENRLAFFAVAEAFLAKHLGGRYQPIGKNLAGSTLKVGASWCPAFQDRCGCHGDRGVRRRARLRIIATPALRAAEEGPLAHERPDRSASSPRAMISRRRPRASALPPRLLSSAGREAEGRSLPDPLKDRSKGRPAHREIRAHHGGSAPDPC
jgi:Prolyl oligopeptidase family